MPNELPRLETSHLLAPLHAELMSLLRALSAEDWEKPTAAREWRVRDVAAHVLDGQLRRVSAGRDGHRPLPDREIAGYGDLVGLLNDLNASWVAVARRFSTRVLVELLEESGAAASAHLASVPPNARALFSVAWAGEDESEAWFDVGREYTEWWHHQMQIRDAVGAPLLLEERFFRPLLELSLRALPRAYAAVEAPEGTALVLEVEGAGDYTLRREPGGWHVLGGAVDAPSCLVRMNADTAWRLLYNALDPAATAARLDVTGDAALAAPLVRARSVMV